MKNLSLVVGVWDVVQQDTRLGSLFLFIHELNCAFPNRGKIYILNSSTQHQPLVEMCRCFSHHNIVLSSECLDCIDLRTLLHTKTPESLTSRTGSMKYLNTLFLQGKRVRPMPDYTLLSRNPHAKTTIAVHLKYNENDVQSNANQHAWFSAMDKLLSQHRGLRFILIGDDAIELPFMSLDGVSRLQGSVTDYFTLVCDADAFMGMSSAFCAAALVGDKPYRVWKHIGHHTAIMEAELTPEQQFPFALWNQKMLIAMDDADSIIYEANEMLKAMDNREKTNYV